MEYLVPNFGSAHGGVHVVHWSRQGDDGEGGLRSNPIPAGLAACPAFHNSGGFVSEEGGRAAFLRGWGHQRRRAASKATQSLGVDDCNPPFSPLLATPTSSGISSAHAHTGGRGRGGGSYN